MTPAQIRKTLETAMKDKQPALYAQMKSDGTLAETLNRLAANVEQAAAETHEELANDRQFQSISDPLLKVQEANSRLKAAQEVALQQSIEEIESLEAA